MACVGYMLETFLCVTGVGRNFGTAPFNGCTVWRRLCRATFFCDSRWRSQAMKSKNEESLQSGCKGPDAVGRLYWIVPQCGDITVFKLYRVSAAASISCAPLRWCDALL